MKQATLLFIAAVVVVYLLTGESQVFRALVSLIAVFAAARWFGLGSLSQNISANSLFQTGFAPAFEHFVRGLERLKSKDS